MANSPRGLSGDIQRAREGASASAEELKLFISQFRGKSPQEVMGVIGGSGLIRATIQATVLTVIGMTAFTVGPYGCKQVQGPTVKKVAAAPAPAAKPAETKAAEPAQPTAAPAAGATKTSAAAPPPAGEKLDPANATNKQIMEKLGVGQSKSADPKANPLENSADDLLKDLK